MSRTLKMKDVTQLAGVSKSTVLYYISRGLLPEPLKTSRNTADYPAVYLEIIPVIRYLQEHMHLPLAVIKQLIDGIGFENLSVERAIHDYETFVNPLKNNGKNPAVYCREELGNASNLSMDELSELESRGLLLSLSGESYYDDDLLAADAYKTLKGIGIEFPEVEKLAENIRELALLMHALYHKKAAGLSPDSEQKITGVMHKEFDTVFKYLISKHLQMIYKAETS